MGIETDIEADRINRKPKNKPSHMCPIDCLKGPKTTQWERTVFSISSDGKVRYVYAIEWSCMLTLHNIEKLTQNGSKT